MKLSVPGSDFKGFFHDSYCSASNQFLVVPVWTTVVLPGLISLLLFLAPSIYPQHACFKVLFKIMDPVISSSCSAVSLQ